MSVLCFFVTNCSKNANDSDFIYEIKFQKLFTIGENEDSDKYAFAQISDILADEKDNIYVCDSKEHCIKVYTAEGTYLRTIGKQGQGPGELLGPRIIEWGPNQKLYIFQINNRRISVFDTSGIFLSSFNFRMAEVSDMAVDPYSGDVFLSELYGFVKNDRKFVQKYNQNGTYIKSFCDPFIMGETSNGKQCAPILLDIQTNGNLLCCALYPYEMKLFSSDGKLIKVISKATDIFSQKKEFTSSSSFSYFIVRAGISKCLILPDDKILVRIEDFGENYFEEILNIRAARQKGKRYIRSKLIYYEYLDSIGNHLQTFNDPFNGGQIRFIDSKNFAYVANTKNDYPVLEKYKIDFQEKIAE